MNSQCYASTVNTIRELAGARSLGAALVALAAVTAAPALGADAPIAFRNAGMEQGANRPEAWEQGTPVAGVQLLWDQKTAHGGKASLCLRKTAQRYFPIAQWSQSTAVDPSGAARKLKVRCWVKAESVTKAIIDVPYQGQQAGHVWAVYLGQKQPTDPVLSHDWKLYEGIVDVPGNISKIGIAFQIYGPGNVWFDDLQVAWVR